MRENLVITSEYRPPVLTDPGGRGRERESQTCSLLLFWPRINQFRRNQQIFSSKNFFVFHLRQEISNNYISFVTLLVTLQDQSYLKRKLCGILKFVYRQEALCSLKILTFRVLLPYRYKINSSVKQSWFDGLLIWFIVKGKLQGFINDCRF